MKIPKLRLRERWRGFKKRSIDYKVAMLYFGIALVLFLMAVFSAYKMAAAYNNGEVEVDPEQIPSTLEALSFVSLLIVFAGLPAIVSMFCLIVGMLFLLADYHSRLKKLEKQGEPAEE